MKFFIFYQFISLLVSLFKRYYQVNNTTKLYNLIVLFLKELSVLSHNLNLLI